MYPIIFDFGLVDIFGFQFRLAIYSFGLMLVVAFYTCYFLLNYDLNNAPPSQQLPEYYIPNFSCCIIRLKKIGLSTIR